MADNKRQNTLDERAAPDLCFQAQIPDKKVNKPKKLHYEGHRDRLRQRFEQTDGEGLADYEFLELLLFRSIPRADTKPLAKALLARFGSLAEVFSADKRQLQEIKGCGPSVALDLKIIKKINERASRSKIIKRNVFNTWDSVLAYCKATMANEPVEQLRILLLDAKNALIKDKRLQVGTVNQTPVYPREVLKYAIEYYASGIILVHNHPSGDSTPSKADIAMTHKIIQAAAFMGITIHDHLIIAKHGSVSFKKLEFI